MIKYLVVTFAVLTRLSVFGISPEQTPNISGLPDPGCYPGEVCDDC